MISPAQLLLSDNIIVLRIGQPQGEALFDVRVVDTDAQSHISRFVADILVSAEEEKKRKYR